MSQYLRESLNVSLPLVIQRTVPSAVVPPLLHEDCLLPFLDLPDLASDFFGRLSEDGSRAKSAAVTARVRPFVEQCYVRNSELSLLDEIASFFDASPPQTASSQHTAATSSEATAASPESHNQYRRGVPEDAVDRGLPQLKALSFSAFGGASSMYISKLSLYSSLRSLMLATSRSQYSDALFNLRPLRRLTKLQSLILYSADTWSFSTFITAFKELETCHVVFTSDSLSSGERPPLNRKDDEAAESHAHRSLDQSTSRGRGRGRGRGGCTDSTQPSSNNTIGHDAADNSSAVAREMDAGEVNTSCQSAAKEDADDFHNRKTEPADVICEEDAKPGSLFSLLVQLPCLSDLSVQTSSSQQLHHTDVLHLSSMPMLRRLSIASRLPFPKGSLYTALSQRMDGKQNTLEELSLGTNNFEGSITLVGQASGAGASLRTLRVPNTRSAFTEISRFQQLTTLDLSASWLNTVDFENIGNCTTLCRTLRELNLNNTMIIEGKDLAPLCKHFQRLETLSLMSSNALDADAFELIPNLTSLTTLDLSYPRRHLPSECTFFKQAVKMTKLQALSLAGSTLNLLDDVLVDLGMVRSLTSLNLSGCVLPETTINHHASRNHGDDGRSDNGSEATQSDSQQPEVDFLPLRALPFLSALTLSCVDDLNPHGVAAISTFPALQRLAIDGCPQIDDTAHLAPLSQCAPLHTVVVCESFSDRKDELPQCLRWRFVDSYR